MPRKKKNQSAGNSAVDEVTQNLGVDPAAGPEQAAADEAAKSAAADQETLDRAAQEGAAAQAASDGMDLTDVQENPPSAGEEETKPEQPTEPQEEEQGAPVVQLSERMRQQLTPQETPAPRQSKKQKAEEAQAAKIALKTQSPSTKRLGPLSTKVPGAEHVKIHKRSDDGMPGKRAYVGDYDVYDLSQSQDLETFIARYIKPKWGAGEYQITGVDAKGQEFDAGVVKLIDPVPEPTPQQQQQGVTAMDLLQTLLQERRDRELASMRNKPQETPPVNPVQQLGEMFDLQQRVGESTEKKNEGVFASMIQAMSQQTNAMMQMMMAQQAKGEERMATLLETVGRPKEMDPVLGALLAKLLDDKNSSNTMPAPPPPPPPKNPAEDLKTLAEAMALMKGNDDKLLGYILNREDKEKMGIRDILELMKQNITSPGTDDLKKTLENVQLMTQTAQSLSGGAGSGFWEFASALVSNQDLAGTVGEAIRSRVGTQGRAPQQQQYRVLPNQTLSAREEEINKQIQSIQQRRLLIAERKLQAEKQGLEEDLVNDTARHRPFVTQDNAVAQPPPQQPEAPPVADDQDMAAVERTQERMGGKLPQFPPDTAEHINAMVLAEDDGTLVENIIRMLTYLSELDDWRKFAELQMNYLQNGDKKNFLAFMGAFFDGLIKIRYMDEKLKKRSLEALEKHFDLISDKTREGMAEDEEGEEPPEDEDEDLEEPPE